MERTPQTITKAGLRTLEGGMNSGDRANLIEDNQNAYAVNVQVRGGYPTNRPGFKQIKLVFDTTDNQDWFEQYHVQGASYYRSNNGKHLIIASIGGRLFKIDPTIQDGVSQNVWLLTATTYNNQALSKAWFCQAEQYLVVQDNDSAAWIYDGNTLRRSSASSNEVPGGSIMAYGQGRLFVVEPSGKSYLAGDIVNGGTEVIQFIENTEALLGGSLPSPFGGEITGLTFVNSIDRSIGQGDLMVFTKQGIATARVSEDRQTWKNIEFQPITLKEHGGVADRMIVTVNGDILYRSQDGVRSLALSRRDFTTAWGSTPISGEGDRILDFDSEAMLQYGSAVVFDNRLLMTVWPKRWNYGYVNQALLALDFDPVGTMRGKQPPAWDGLWTGLRPWCLVVGEFNSVQRCFAFHQNSSSENELWEVTKSDWTDDGEEIPSVLESKEMDYGSPLELKRIEGGRLDADRISGTVEFDLKYRTDDYPCWNDWYSWEVCAENDQCEVVDGCQIIHNFQAQRRTNMILKQPPEVEDTTDGKPMRTGYTHQFRIAWTGKAFLKNFVVRASHQPDSQTGPVVEDQTCRELDCCDIDPNSYQIDGDASITVPT